METAKFILIAVMLGCVSRGLWYLAFIVKDIAEHREK